MRIGSRMALQVSMFVFIATGTLLLLVNFQLKEFAVTIAKDKARFFLEEKQATIDYVVEHLRPPLFKLIKEKKCLILILSRAGCQQDISIGIL